MSEKIATTGAKRLEDPALLRGEARFIDDIAVPGMGHAAFVRSPHGHAAIGAIDKTAAAAIRSNAAAPSPSMTR